jgi:hypothetical protein
VAQYIEPGADSYFDVIFGPGLGTGFDVVAGVPYTGWCIEANGEDPTTPVWLHCSLDSGLPGNLNLIDWDKVNYILNHKMGTWEEVQSAIWTICTGYNPWPVTANVTAMVNAANNNGPGFEPAPGHVIAVILYSGDGGIDPRDAPLDQELIIELEIPGGEGCTPGYWKNHYESWPLTGISINQDFDTTFGVDYFDPDISLSQAVWLGGGGVKKIARHGTAALLSASHPEVAYPFTPAEVISMVQAGNVDPLVLANELGCEVTKIKVPKVKRNIK